MGETHDDHAPAPSPEAPDVEAHAVSSQSTFSTYGEKVTPLPEDRDLVLEIPGTPREVADPFAGE